MNDMRLTERHMPETGPNGGLLTAKCRTRQRITFCVCCLRQKKSLAKLEF